MRTNKSTKNFGTATLVALLAVGLTPAMSAVGIVADASAGPLEALGGTQLWTSNYDGPESFQDEANAIAVSPDGLTVFAVGSSQSAETSYDWTTMAYESLTGTELWVAPYDGPVSGYDRASDIALSPDGGTVFVTGYSDGNGTASNYPTDATTVAYDAATGAELWVARYDGPAGSLDRAVALSVSPDGDTVFVTGNSRADGVHDAYDDYTTIAYDAATGAERWVARHDGAAGSIDRAAALSVSPDGSTVFVTGTASGIGPEDCRPWGCFPTRNENFTTVAYDASSGAEMWVAEYDGPVSGKDGAGDIAVSPDGETVFVTGDSFGDGTRNDYATVAYDAASGDELWVARYDDPANWLDSATALAVSPDGGTVFVTGNSYGDGDDYLTVAYSAATGAELWAARYDGLGIGSSGSRDRSSDIALSPDGGTVLVTGTDMGEARNMAATTVAYDAATGDEQWVARYDGLGPESGNAIAVDPLGLRAYVAGSEDVGDGSRNNMLAVAYLLEPKP